MSKTPIRIYQFPGGLRFSKDGHWYHDGSPVTHQGLASYLARNLAWSGEAQCWGIPSGGWFIPVEIEDTPFIVLGIDLDLPEPAVQLSDETIQEFNPAGLRFGSDDVPYVSIKNSSAPGGKIEARFSRSAMQSLISRIEEKEGEFYLTVGAVPVRIRI